MTNRTKASSLLAASLLPLVSLASVACSGDDDDDPARTKYGSVMVELRPGGRYSAQIDFMSNVERGGAAPAEIVGPCKVVEKGASCGCVIDDGEEYYPTLYYPAGRVRIEGGAWPLVFEAGVDRFDGEGQPFAGGERLTAFGDGSDDVSPFQTALVAPSSLKLSEPVPTVDLPPPPGEATVAEAPKAFAFKTGQDATFRWAKGVSGTQVTVSFGRGFSPDDVGAVATCTFDAAAGEGAVPAAVVDRLAQGTGYVELHAATMSQAEATAGEFPVTFMAIANGVGPGDQPFGGPVVFE